MSLGTLMQSITEDLHSLISSDQVYRKLIDSMRFHREQRLWFSERTFRFNLVADKAEYAPGEGPPLDMQEIVGKELWLWIDGDTDSRDVITRLPSREMESMKISGMESDQPVYWDFWGNKLRFWPTPDSADDQVEGRYVVDVGVPVARYENSAWAFYAPDGLRKLSAAELAAFSNDWTDQRGAGPMVRNRAMHLICKEYLRDFDAANEFLSLWLEQKAQVEAETEAKTAGATEVVPNLGLD